MGHHQADQYLHLRVLEKDERESESEREREGAEKSQRNNG